MVSYGTPSNVKRGHDGGNDERRNIERISNNEGRTLAFPTSCNSISVVPLSEVAALSLQALYAEVEKQQSPGSLVFERTLGKRFTHPPSTLKGLHRGSIICATLSGLKN